MNVVFGFHTRKTDLSVYTSSGLIELSARIVRELGCQQGDTIGLLEEGVEHYLCVMKKKGVGRSAATVCRVNRGSRFMRVWSVDLAKKICSELSLTEEPKKVSLYCGEAIDTAYGKAIPIITKNPTICK